MKVAVVILALAAATTVSSAAPSHDFAARAPAPVFWNTRGCPHWWKICGLKAKRDAGAAAGGTSQEAIADQYAKVVATLHDAKLLAESGEAGKATLDSTGYTYAAFLFDFYGGDSAPPTAKHTPSSKPGCVELGLCDV
jgi:hypothetical protein